MPRVLRQGTTLRPESSGRQAEKPSNADAGKVMLKAFLRALTSLTAKLC